MKDLSSVVNRLRTASTKLQGLGYLIGNEDDAGATPLNISNIRCGIGELISELAEEIHRVLKVLEEIELDKIKTEGQSSRKRGQSKLTKKNV